MKANIFVTAVFFLAVLFCAAGSNAAVGAPPDSDLSRVKKESESKGYVFLTSREEIVARAKKEGKLRLLSSLGPDTFRELRNVFIKQYPFIDTHVEELDLDAQQRFLLTLQAGGGADWDLFPFAVDFFREFLPQVKKIDILAMARQGVLQIPASTVDPKNRNVVSIASAIFGIAYNKKLIAPNQVPDTWEDFLKPEFKGKKFMEDIRPVGLAALAAGLGEQWAMNFARKIKEQEPVWVRGQTRALTALVAGERGLLNLAYYHSCVRAKEKDVSKSVECRLIEPVPARIHEFKGINANAPHPHAGLLWLEFSVSPLGQSIIDKLEPLKSSIYVPGSELAKVTQGKRLSVNNWETLPNTEKWMRMTIEAFGFPTAERK